MNQGIFSPLSIVALESIDFQVKDKCVKRLEVIFEDIGEILKEKKPFGEKEIAGFTELIQSELRKRFKLEKLTFIIHDSEYLNAFAVPPDITKNSVMYKTYYGMANKAKDGKVTLKDVNSEVGTVNSQHATVGGIFTSIPCTVAITKGTLITSELSALSKVALIMHEVGHIFTYLETLSYTFSTCFILADTLSRLNSAHSQEEKIKIYKNVESVTGIDISNKDTLVESEDESVSMISIFKDLIDGTRSEYGSSIYDMRSFESLSDQFAARMGLTVPLAQALDVILRDSQDSESFVSNYSIWMMNVIRWVSYLVMVVILPTFGGFLLFLEVLILMISPFERVYDKPGERIERIKHEIILQMKQSTLDDQRRSSLAKDLETVNAILALIEDKESYVEKVWLFFSASARDQKEKRILLQDLQALTNNNLFAHANLLKLLKV